MTKQSISRVGAQAPSFRGRLTLVGLALGFVSLIFVLLLSLVWTAQPQASAATVTTASNLVNFQGRLADHNGYSIPNGSYNMKFRLYNAKTGGSPIWEADYLVSNSQGIQITNGLFSIELGDSSKSSLPQGNLSPSLFATNPSLYLSVELPSPATATTSSPTWNEGEMSPRQALASAPFAMNADAIDGIDSSQLARTDQGNTFTGANNFTGSLQQSGSDVCTAANGLCGSAGGVTSVNSLTGDLTIQGSSEIGITNAGSTISLSIQADSIGDAQLRFNTGQDLTTTSTPTFAGLTLTGVINGTSASFSGTVSGADATANNQFVTLGQANTSYAPAAGSANYIQNQIASPQSASFNISGAATANGGFYFQQGWGLLAKQNGARIQLGSTGNTWAGMDFIVRNDNPAAVETNAFSYKFAGNLNLGGNVTSQRDFLVGSHNYSGAYTIQNAATFAVSGAPGVVNGASIVNAYSIWSQGGTVRVDTGGISNVGLQIAGKTGQTADLLQLKDGSNNAMVVFDASGDVGIGTASPAYKLDIQGGAGIVGQFSGRVIGANAVNTNEFVTLGQANGNYIQNTTSPQTADFNITGSGTVGGNFTNNGSALFKNSADSTTAFQIQNSSGSNLLVANTTNQTISVGSGTVAASLIGSAPGPAPQFGAGKWYGGYTDPVAVAVADFNGDGKPDLATANWWNGSVMVNMNTGNGTYGSSTAYQVSSSGVAVESDSMWSIATADFNGDGKSDLVVTDITDSSVAVLMNTGTGTFAAPVKYTVNSAPAIVTTADFNGDGKPDIAVTDSTAGTVSVLMNTGTGTFAAKVDYTTGTSSWGITTADLNGDSRPDLVVTNQNANTISVLMNNGNGTFAAKVDYATGSSPQFVTTADLNGDGRPDLIATNQYSNSISVFINNGNGTFASQISYPVGISPQGVAAGDFNRDGKLDIAVVNMYDGTGNNGSISILTGNGDGTFATQSKLVGFRDPYTTTVADVDGDGHLDLVVADFGHNWVTVILNTGLQNLQSGGLINPVNTEAKLQVVADSGQAGLLIQSASTQAGNLFQAQSDSGNVLMSLSSGGTLSVGNTTAYNIVNGSVLTQQLNPAVSYNTGSGPYSVTTADLNSDSKPDAVVANINDNTVSVLMNNGNGTFAAQVTYATGVSPRSVVAADVNGDGKPDLVVTNYTDNTVSVLMNNGNGTFAAQVTYATGVSPRSVVAADVNGDGKPDLVVVNQGANTVSVLMNSGNGTFAAKVDYAVGSGPRFAVAGDFNGDGHIDIAVENTGGNTVSVLMNSGTGTFAAQVTYATGTTPLFIATADLNADGKPDLIVANYSDNTVSVLMNSGTGTFATKVDYGVGTQPASIATADLNADGKPDVVVANFGTSNVSVLINNGNGTLASQITHPVGTNPPSLTAADVNGDGLPDILTANSGSNNISVLTDKLLTPSAPKVSVINNDSAASGLILQGASGQASPLLVIQDASGSALFTVGAAGDLTVAATGASSFAGTLTIAGNLSGSTGSFTGTVSGADATANNQFVTLGQANTNYQAVGDYFLQGGNSFGGDATIGTNDNYALNLETNNATRLTIDTSGNSTFSGNILPSTDNTYSLGSSTNRFKDLYLSGNSLHMGSDTNEGVISYNTSSNNFNVNQAFVVQADNSDALAIQGASGADTIFRVDTTNQTVNIVGGGNFIYTWGGAASDTGSAVAQAGDGGYYMAGSTYSYGPYTRNAFLAKYNSRGNLSWSKTWGGATNYDYGFGMTATSDGGAIITGLTYSFGAGGGDMFVAKYDSAGNLSWSKTWGGTAQDYGNSIVQTSDGGYAVTGITNSFGTGGDMFVAKYDSAGNLSWSKTWGGTAQDYGNSIVQTSDGGYAVTGYTASYGAGNSDLFVAKYDSAGNLLWNKTWGTLNGGSGKSIIQTSDGNLLVVGETYFDSWDSVMVQFDSAGNVLWQKAFDGTDIESGADVIETSTGNFAVTGKTKSFGMGDYDAFIAVYNHSGDIASCNLSICHDIVSGVSVNTPTVTAGGPSVTETSPAITLGTPTVVESSPQATNTPVSIGLTMSVSGNTSLMGKVGIGTSTPTADLQVNGNQLIQADDGNALLIQNSSSVNLFNADTTNQRITIGDGTIVSTTSLGAPKVSEAGSFSSPTQYSTGNNAKGVSSGDFNGDGKPDIVVATYGSGGLVQVYMNNGDGTFATPTNYGTGYGLEAVRTADLNNDGHVDIVAAGYGGTLSVLINKGDGTFNTPVTYSASTNLRTVTIADFNGDGYKDLATSNSTGSTISVLMNNGDGTFAAEVTYASGASPYTIDSADFNGDGKPDIVAANDGQGTVSVLMNNGDGTFAAPVSYTTQFSPWSVRTGDLNGDGKSDIVAVNDNNNSVSVLLNNGDGTFAASVNYSVQSNPNYAAIGDVNADGKPDIVVANSSSNTLSALINNGNGTFASQVVSSNLSVDFPFDIVMADFNGDGQADVAVANQNVNVLAVFINRYLKWVPGVTTTQTETSRLQILTDGNNGGVLIQGPSSQETNLLQVQNVTGNLLLRLSGAGKLSVGDTPIYASIGTATVPSSFATKIDYATSAYPVSVATADFNGDGKPDVATADDSFSGSISILMNNGDGTFAPRVDYATSASPNAIATGDFNGDGKPDLVTVNYDSPGLASVLMNNGDGTFAPRVDYATSAFPISVVTSDFNGDGKVDLATVNNNSSGTVSVLLGNGDGTFAAKVDYATSAYPYAIATGDFNGDGKPDLVTVNDNSSGLASVFINNGDGTFAAKVDYATSAYPVSVATADFNGDGKVDLATVNNNSSGTVSVLLGNGDGTFAAKVDYATSAYPYAIATGDFNIDGKPDLVIVNDNSSGLASVFINNGDGTFAAKVDYATSAYPVSVATADFNGDGSRDIVTVSSNASGSVSVLMSALFTQQPVAPMLSVVSSSTDSLGLLIQGSSGQVADLLHIQDSTGNPLFVVSNVGNLTVAGSGAFTGTVSGADATASNQFVTLGQANNSYFINGGNSFGSDATLGTNDSYALNFKTNNATHLTINAAGNVTGTGTLAMAGTGASSFGGSLGLDGIVNPQGSLQIANSSWITSTDSAGTGTVNMFQVNSNNQIQIGAALNVGGALYLPTDAGQVTFSDLPVDNAIALGAPESYTMRVGSTNALTVYGEGDGAGGIQNVRVAVGGSINPQYTLDVAGTLNASGAASLGSTLSVTGAITGSSTIQGTQLKSTVATGTAPLTVNSTTVVTNLNADLIDGYNSSAFAPATGSANYIQNGTTPQTADFNITGGGTVGGNFTNNGAALFKNGTDSTTAFQIQNAAGTSTIFNVDTTGSKVTIGSVATGGVLVNNGATLSTAVALGDFATGGSIGSAATTVDTHTTFTINQTTAGQSLSLPAPTDTTAGRMIYLANIGSATFSIATVGTSIGPGTNAPFIWNGTAWTAPVSGAGGSGVNTVGALDGGTASAAGATIVGSTIYLQSASFTNPGLVNTTTQTFTGDKTFKSTTNSITAFQIQNSTSSNLLLGDTQNMVVSSAGILSIQGAGTSTFTGTVSGANATLNNQFVTLGQANTNYQAAGSYAPASGSANYIQNTTTPQTADFNITGNGVIGNNLTVAKDSTLSGRLILQGTNTGSFSYLMQFSSTLNSSYTGTQYGFDNEVNFNPTGASISNVIGAVTVPTISGSALNVSGLYGQKVGIRTGAGYTGLVTDGYGLDILAPQISGSQLFTNYSGITIDANGTNSGNTSGTITNRQIFIKGNTAAAGIGGTLTNYGLLLTQPSGSGGTTNNYGIYIQGNGAGTTNYSLYNASTAPSLFAGALQGAGASFTGTVSGANATVNNQFVTLGQANTNYAPASGSANYIQNTTTPQTASFNVTGTGVVAGNFTNNGAALFKNSANSVTAFAIQNTAGASILGVDTSGNNVVLGSSTQAASLVFQSGSYKVTIASAAQSNDVTLSIPANTNATDQICLKTLNNCGSGSTKVKVIALNAEYAGAALDQASDPSCTSAHDGIMASGFNDADRQNYYEWVSGSSSTNCYDVVVQVLIPTDFDSWAAAPKLYLSNSSSSSSAVCVEPVDTTGTIDAAYAGYSCSTSGITLISHTLTGLTGTYTASTSGAPQYMTLKIRLSSANTSDITRIGTILLTYNSSF